MIRKVAAGVAIVVCVFVIGLWLLPPKEQLVTKSPDEIVLRSTDVPPEWRAHVQEASASVDNAAIALGTSVDNLQKWGYDAGFGSIFRTAGWDSMISSFVARFSSVSGAKEMFTFCRKRAVTEFTEVTVAQKIGNECMGYTQTREGFTMWGIFFRKANVSISLYVAGPTETFSIDNVVAYAQVIEGRIQ